MAGLFDSLPARSNSDDVTHEWFNAIRNALIAIFGAGAHAATQVAIANSQTNANITGLSFALATYRRAIIKLDIKRNPGASEINSFITLHLTNVNGAWVLGDPIVEGDSTHGMSFNVTVAGQIQYTSNAAGTGTLFYRSETFNVAS